MLTDACISSKVDHLYGLKENVIMGRLVPVGTGMKKYRDTEVVLQGDGNEVREEVEEAVPPVDERGAEEENSAVKG